MRNIRLSPVSKAVPEMSSRALSEGASTPLGHHTGQRSLANAYVRNVCRKGVSTRLTILAAFLIECALAQLQRSVVIGIDLQGRREFHLRPFVIAEVQKDFARDDQAR